MVSYFHLFGLIEDRQREKIDIFQLDVKGNTHTKTNKASVLYSLRPVRVGVEGSALEVVLKVTVFAGVRANSLAMYKNAKTICVLP